MLNYLDFFTGIIAIYLTVLFFRKRNNDLLIAEKYKNLIFPMFHMLEPYLYKTVNLEIKTTLKKLTVLHENNILYSSPNLIEAIKSCTPISKCSNEDYICLCKTIDKEFDNCCVILGLKKRSFLYRFHHEQYASKQHKIILFVLYILEKILLGIVLPFVVFSIFAVLLKLLQRLT